jgi:SAM-dependent methyltransferase
MQLGGNAGKQTSSVFTKYPSDSTFGGKKVLNLGCGFAKFAAVNVTNLDAFDNCKPDVKWDLAVTPLPFEDNTFDFIIANHILEHVPNWWNVFCECARILKPGGRLEVWGPGMGSDGVLGFRDHINVINQCSFFGTFGYTRPNNAWAQDNFEGYGRMLKLKGVELHLFEEKWLKYVPQSLKLWCINHLRNVLYEIGFFFDKMEAEQPKPDFDSRIVEALL